jgi:aromatic-L-amino-acid decarboxylase
VRAALYTSAEAHYSVQRAGEVLGLGGELVRRIPVDAERRMDPEACAAAIDADLRDGIVPVAVVATAGTTLTGAVDDLSALAGVCEPRGVWLHVDGAYGLPAAATPTAGHRFAGLDRVDSATVDAHKWLYVPKACSVLLVRRPSALETTFSHHETYMPHEGEQVHPVDRTLEYSRPLRALKLWLPSPSTAPTRSARRSSATSAGRAPGRAHRRRSCARAARPPQLSAVCFRAAPPRSRPGGATTPRS